MPVYHYLQNFAQVSNSLYALDVQTHRTLSSFHRLRLFTLRILGRPVAGMRYVNKESALICSSGAPYRKVLNAGRSNVWDQAQRWQPIVAG